MKSDIDRLMQQAGFDGLLVVGPGFHNPSMVYLTGGAHLTGAELICKRGQTGHLYCAAMERDEAARTGLIVHQHDMAVVNQDLIDNGGDYVDAAARRYVRMFTEQGLLSGRVALFGLIDAGVSYAVFSSLRTLLPELELVGQLGGSILLNAMATKDDVEVARIRHMGQITTAVIAEVADFLTGHTTQNEILIKPDGLPLTIGDVRRRINLSLAERGAENPEATIFAIGRDAGVPHSIGSDADRLRLGQTIVFDIFPCEPGGGYFYDITRTWCLGYAPDEALQLYGDVRAVFEQLRSELRLGAPVRHYQLRACELFQARGHSTILENPQTTDGYVHSLGHGVGLNIHELPAFRSNAPESQQLEPGNVVTLEPGLYYPERGMGVRLEDTLWARPDGVFETLAEFSLDLVLPMG